MVNGGIDAWLYKPFSFAVLKTTLMNPGLPHAGEVAFQAPGVIRDRIF